jgi:hypothetical protein
MSAGLKQVHPNSEFFLINLAKLGDWTITPPCLSYTPNPMPNNKVILVPLAR